MLPGSVAGGPGVNRDTLLARLTPLRLGDGYGQDTITEPRLDCVLIHVAKRQAAFEAPIDAFAESAPAVFRLGPLLAAQREHADFKQDLDVLFLKAWELSGHPVFLVGVL